MREQTREGNQLVVLTVLLPRVGSMVRGSSGRLYIASRSVTRQTWKINGYDTSSCDEKLACNERPCRVLGVRDDPLTHFLPFDLIATALIIENTWLRSQSLLLGRTTTR